MITSFAGIIRTHGRERPDHPALEFEGTTVTFGELDTRSSQLATALAALGVTAETRVAFLDKNGPEFFETTFALGKLNAVNVAVNWRLAPTEMAQIMNDARATTLIVGAEFFAHVEKIDAGPKGAVISFRKNEFPKPEKLIGWLATHPSLAKVRPDQKLSFSRTWATPEERLAGVHQVLLKLAELAV